MKIAFNKIYPALNEQAYLSKVLQNRMFSGEGEFAERLKLLLAEKYAFQNVFLTASCTSALELAALLLDVQAGDEIIVPSYTFVSTANAFARCGAKIVFADSQPNHPNMDENTLEKLITSQTKAIVVVHYAGMACNMDAISAICKKHDVFLIEDAALAIHSFFNNKALGSFGDLACFSFHQTKNISCGEGGMLVVNNENFIEKADLVWNKGTNRTEFINHKVHAYEWKTIGSSFTPSEFQMAVLLAQLEEIEQITQKRLEVWNLYHQALKKISHLALQLPLTPQYPLKHNAHTFYLLANSRQARDIFIAYMKQQGVEANFHYGALHLSAFAQAHFPKQTAPNAAHFANSLLRLPLHTEISSMQMEFMLEKIDAFAKTLS